MNRVIRSILLLLCCLCLGCHSNDDITGSYEEADLSGRHLDGDVSAGGFVWTEGTPERYFRFHFRQFGDDIGGTFESFDLSSHELFNQIPTYMENTVSLYYCARIDYGYVRNNTAYIFFTDREQRQWGLVLNTSQDSPVGVLKRAYFNHIGDVKLDDPDYYLQEDVEYFEKLRQGKMPYSQIALQKMEKDTKRSLDCVYYYKSRKFDVALPVELTNQLLECEPSMARCDNIKLAVIGMMPQHRIPNSENVQIQEIITARLDDCDITTERKRMILLRENPYKIISANSSGPYIATVIAYKDKNANDQWDSAEEPIIAALDKQTLVFYDSVPGTMYGNSLSGESYEIPIIHEDKFDDSTGWFLFNDESSEQMDIYRVIQKLTPHTSDSLILKTIDVQSEDNGCYLSPDGDFTSDCRGIIPILLQ